MRQSRQLNRSIVKLFGTAICTIVFLACGAFIFTSDALPVYGQEVGLEAMKQRAMIDIAFVLLLGSGVGALLLNLKAFNDGN